MAWPLTRSIMCRSTFTCFRWHDLCHDREWVRVIPKSQNPCALSTQVFSIPCLKWISSIRLTFFWILLYSAPYALLSVFDIRTGKVVRNSCILSIAFSPVLLALRTSVSASHLFSLSLISCLFCAHCSSCPGEEMCEVQ